MIYHYALVHEPRRIYLGTVLARRAFKMEQTNTTPEKFSLLTSARVKTTPSIACKAASIKKVLLDYCGISREAVSLNALVLTCRQIHLEADSTNFYTNNQFDAADTSELEVLILGTRVRHLQAIRELGIASIIGDFNLEDHLSSLGILKSFTGLKILTLGGNVSSKSRNYNSTYFTGALVKATWDLHSLQTLRVKTHFSGDSIRHFILIRDRGSEIDPDAIPG